MLSGSVLEQIEEETERGTGKPKFTCKTAIGSDSSCQRSLQVRLMTSL